MYPGRLPGAGGRAVEGLPSAAPPDQQGAAQQVLVAREEDPIDAAARLLQAGRGLRARHDDDVTGRNADDEISWNSALQAGPEIAGEEEAGLETLKREHQRRGLAVELGPSRQYLEVLESGAAQRVGRHLHLVEVGVGDDTPAELRAKAINNGKVPNELVSDRRRIYPIGASGGEEGNERGPRHLHTRNLAAAPTEEKPRVCYVRFVQATFFGLETSGSGAMPVTGGAVPSDRPQIRRP
jgi:hypothetical protein